MGVLEQQVRISLLSINLYFESFSVNSSFSVSLSKVNTDLQKIQLI